MQINPFSAAAQAAGVVSQASSKDSAKNAGTGSSEAASQVADIHVEDSGSADADRDAQGQGDGMQRHPNQPGSDAEPEEGTPQANVAPDLPGEEPGQLDIIG